MLSAYARFLRRLGRYRWFAAMGRRTAALDGWLYQVSGGRFGMTGPTGVAFSPLLLTTTGRRSGRLRTTPVMYLEDGDRYVITSQNFGQDRPAAWPLNLDADPAATVQVGRRRLACTARRASETEAERYWPRFIELWPAHESYRNRSGVRKTYILQVGEPWSR